jgi:hypothetical protein
MRAGDSVLMPKPGATQIPHLWIVVTDPNQDREVVIVNITSYKAISDNTVVLKKGDHPFIVHDSTVEYMDARIVLVQRLEEAIRGAAAIRKQPCPPETLAKIQKGILKSPHAARKVVKFCSACWAKPDHLV